MSAADGVGFSPGALRDALDRLLALPEPARAALIRDLSPAARARLFSALRDRMSLSARRDRVAAVVTALRGEPGWVVSALLHSLDGPARDALQRLGAADRAGHAGWDPGEALRTAVLRAVERRLAPPPVSS